MRCFAVAGTSKAPSPEAPEFDLDTPIVALGSRLSGRLFIGALRLMLAREAGRSPSLQGAIPTEALLEMPVRALVLLGKGRFSLRQATALVDLLNGHPLRAIRGLLC